MRRLIVLLLSLLAKLLMLEAASPSNRPNIILILTDDQDRELGSLNFMPKLKRALTDEGAEFPNAYVTTPMCCPSRSSMLTGLYTHNHHVYTNHDNCSSFAWRQQFEHRMFGNLMHESGYRTVYIGKYLNEYNGSYVPQGWDDWVGLLYNSKYYNYTLNVNGRLQPHGFDYHRDYLPDLIANESIRVLHRQRLLHRHQPLLMVLSFPSPHGREDAAPQYQTAFGDRSAHTHRTPAWNAAPNPDKEWLLSYTQRMTPLYKKFTDILQQKRLQTLQSVDDAVERLVGRLRLLGMLDSTYVIYTSDHGYHLGQFGLLKGKSLPYEFDVKVPFIVRGPGVGRATRVPNIVLNVDLAPTLLDLAGLGPQPDMDGRSLVKLLALSLQQRGPAKNGTVEVRRAKAWRESFLIERGKLTSRIARLRDKLEATKNRIVSKRARLDEECKAKELRYPCQPGQKWFCWRRKDGTGLRKLKCRHAVLNMKFGAKPITTAGGRRLCPCDGDSALRSVFGRGPLGKLPERTALAERRRDFELWNDPLLRNISSANFSRQCRFSAAQQRVVCSPYLSERAWARDSRAVDQVIVVLKKYFTAYTDLRRVLRRSKPQKVQLCECPESPFSVGRLRISLRRNRQSRRRRRRRKKNKKKSKMKYCNEKNMNCFVHTRDHWRTPPFWKYMPICFCGNSNNNTYWCVRTINETHNTLYCEYVTGFISFFDLNRDPYQLTNRVHTLPYWERMQIQASLARLRRCRGPRQCTVRGPHLGDRRAAPGRHRRRRLKRKLRFLIRWRQLLARRRAV